MLEIEIQLKSKVIEALIKEQGERSTVCSRKEVVGAYCIQ